MVQQDAKHKWLVRLLLAVGLTALILYTVVPFYWMVLTSFKPEKELFSLQNPLVVTAPTMKHYQQLLKFHPFGSWLGNSFLVAGGVTLISLVLGSLAAYGLTRLPFRGAALVAQLTLVGYLLPRTVLVIPLYRMLGTLGLIDSLTGLGLTYITFSLPFCIWLLTGYFKAIPKELDEAAMIDGCTPLSALIKVVLPLVRPGLVAAAIFAFSMCWNEYMYPLAFIKNPTLKPLTTGIGAMQMGDTFAWGRIMAAGTLATIPIVILFGLIHRHIVSGLASGAVKG